MYSLNRALLVNGSSIGWALDSIEGYENSVRSLKGSYVPLSGLKAIDNRTVEIRLTRPFRDFLQVLASPYFGIYGRERENIQGGQISNMFEVRRNSAESMTLIPTKENPLYASQIEIEFVKADSPANALENAKRKLVDWVFTIDTSPTIDGYKIVPVDPFNVVVLQLNLKDPKFKSQRARCQFTKSFSQIVNGLPNIGRKLKLGLPFTGGIFADNESPDIKATRQQKIELSYIDSVVTFTGEDLRSISNGLHPVGIKLNIQKMSLRDFMVRVKANKFQVALWGYAPDYFSPDALLNPLLGSGQQYNFSKYSSATFDKKLADGRRAETDRERVSIYDQLFSLVSQDCALAFLGVQRQNMLLSKRYSLPQLSSLGVHTTLLKDQLRAAE